MKVIISTNNPNSHLWSIDFQNEVDEEVKNLLDLKNQYKSATGKDWKPATTTATPPKQADKMPATTTDTSGLKSQIDAQGEKVRKLKSSGASKVHFWLIIST